MFDGTFLDIISLMFGLLFAFRTHASGIIWRMRCVAVGDVDRGRMMTFFAGLLVGQAALVFFLAIVRQGNSDEVAEY